ncbi:HAMP domain-containing methyl-accepting chemotaxis protein, partial [Teichococcus aerophilus]
MNLSVKLKLAGGFGLVILLSLAAGGVAWRNQQSLQATLQDFATIRAQQLRLSGEMRSNLLESVRAEKNAILAAETPVIERYVATMTEKRRAAQEALATLRAVSDAEARRLLDTLQATLERHAPVQDKVRDGAVQNSNNRARALLDQAVLQSAQEARSALARLPDGARAAEAMLLAELAMKDAMLSSSMAELTRDTRQLATALDAVRRQRDALRTIPGAEAASVPLDRWLDAMARAAELVRDGGNLSAAEISMGAARQLVNEIDSQIAAYTTLSQARMQEASNVAIQSGEQAGLVLMLALLLSTLSGAGIAVWLSLSISRGLGQAVALTQAVAEGDLTRTGTIRSGDEIGQLMEQINVMIGRLRGVVGDALQAADNVSSGSQELSASAEELSQGATE